MSKPYKDIERRRIDFEDDLVIVYDESGKQIYKGIEDYEPMKDCDWKWSNDKKAYEYEGYIKICMDI